MTLKNKLYLFLSVLSFLLVLLSIVKNFDSIELIGMQVPIIWIPLAILLLVLPLLNCVEIIKNNDQPNLFYWIGLIFNILAMIFTLRYFKIPLF
jgi:asparagine N-glycosylation enzyme membrane subunit Stt3